MSSSIMISCGEQSGDEHAALLIREIRLLSPTSSFFGMGLEQSRAAGSELIVDAKQLSSPMGFSSVVKSLGAILSAQKKLKAAIKERKPSLLIVIDLPDFNLSLARYAKKRNIPVLYFIPPKVWAWRKKRIHTLKKLCDKIALIFPFEKEFYEKHLVNQAQFVGHPFSFTMSGEKLLSKEAARKALGIAAQKVLAFLPGSRAQEIHAHSSLLSSAAKIIRAAIPECQIIVPVASAVSGITREEIPGVRYVEGNSVTVLRAADAGLLKSGTSNLQAAFCDLPFTMFYRTSRINAVLARALVKLSEYSPVNITIPHSVREIQQEEVTAENLAAEGIRLLSDSEYRETVRGNIAKVKDALCVESGNPYRVVAEMVIQLGV